MADRGWICPVCGCGVAPTVSQCPCAAISTKRVTSPPLRPSDWPVLQPYIGWPNSVPPFRPFPYMTYSGKVSPGDWNG